MKWQTFEKPENKRQMYGSQAWVDPLPYICLLFSVFSNVCHSAVYGGMLFYNNIIFLQFFWTIGSCLTVGVAMAVMFTLGWRWLLGILSIPLFCFILMCWVSKTPHYCLITCLLIIVRFAQSSKILKLKNLQKSLNLTGYIEESIEKGLLRSP